MINLCEIKNDFRTHPQSPMLFAFLDKKNPEIYWLIPISSKIDKYRHEAQKINKYGRCNTIRFGLVLGRVLF